MQVECMGRRPNKKGREYIEKKIRNNDQNNNVIHIYIHPYIPWSLITTTTIWPNHHITSHHITHRVLLSLLFFLQTLTFIHLHMYIYNPSINLLFISLSLSRNLQLAINNITTTIMQEAIPYRTLFHHHSFTINPSSVSVLSSSSSSPNNTESDTTTMVVKMVSENAVIVIGKRGCCMTHVVKRLLLALGVNPAVHELHGEKEEQGIITLLQQPPFEVSDVQFPAVFIGGKLFGGLDRLMATHISGDLVPILKQAGALWLWNYQIMGFLLFFFFFGFSI